MQCLFLEYLLAHLLILRNLFLLRDQDYLIVCFVLHLHDQGTGRFIFRFHMLHFNTHHRS